MNETSDTNRESRLLKQMQEEGMGTRLKTYLKLSGPGFLQSALSLGGGSMASSLYLGVLAGYSMLWLQPVGMLLGIIMLGAIGYVTLVIDERPFRAINRHLNPVLGWGWVLASMLASVIWALPQFSLATGVIQQNLLPEIFGAGGTYAGVPGMVATSAAILAVTLAISWNYDRGRRGVRMYEWVLKGVVAVIVLSFIGVVFRLTFVADSINWTELARGFIPEPGLLFRPAEGFLPLLEGLSDVSAAYWTEVIVSRQQDIMAAAISNAVGINMTFLFAYSMLRRKWGREYQGMMRFDLIFGLLLPFMMVTSCVMIASTSQFHTVPQPGIIEEYPAGWEPAENQVREYRQLLENRVLYETESGGKTVLHPEQLSGMVESLDRGDHVMAATLVTRDAFDLSMSLEPLLGSVFGHFIFGIGVLGMALSSITLMMIISGMVVCEILDKPKSGWAFRAGVLLPGLGVLGPFFWDQAYFWLAIPVSVITFFLLPVAYITFFLMMNNKALLGKQMPTGKRRLTWNILMAGAVMLTTSASLYMLWMRGGRWGLGALLMFLTAVGAGQWYKWRRDSAPG